MSQGLAESIPVVLDDVDVELVHIAHEFFISLKVWLAQESVNVVQNINRIALK